MTPIRETAYISVQPGTEAEFAAALQSAGIGVLQRAPGFLGIEVMRGIERPSVFQLTLTWATLEDHTEGFRGGPLFAEWRAVISPFFAEAPVVEHWAAL
jgi:heme-degrading monooxygenase HmoA